MTVTAMTLHGLRSTEGAVEVLGIEGKRRAVVSQLATRWLRLGSESSRLAEGKGRIEPAEAEGGRQRGAEVPFDRIACQPGQ